MMMKAETRWKKRNIFRGNIGLIQTPVEHLISMANICMENQRQNVRPNIKTKDCDQKEFCTNDLTKCEQVNYITL